MTDAHTHAYAPLAQSRVYLHLTTTDRNIYVYPLPTHKYHIKCIINNIKICI